MKHYRNIVLGMAVAYPGFYDSVHKTAVLYSQYGTASDLTVTTVSSAPAGLPIHSAPDRTRNGVRLGMTLEQVTAIDGPGTLYSNGRYRRLTYSQDFKTSSTYMEGGKRRPLPLTSSPTWASYSRTASLSPWTLAAVCEPAKHLAGFRDCASFG